MDYDKQHITDDELQRLLDIFQENPSASKKELEEKGLWQDFQDLSLLAAASRAERDLPDTDTLLAAFHARQHRKKRLRLRRWSMAVAGVAAVALIVLLWNMPRLPQLPGTHEPVLVFQADTTSTPYATLQAEKDKNNPAPSRQQPPKTWKQTKPDELDYYTSQQLVARADRLSERHTLTVPRGKTFKIILSDSTEVFLNADSRLIYPSRFTGNERSVFLEGEAYFHVAKDRQRPFIVRTHNLQTRVLGTEFNVSSYKDAPTQVTLIEGCVEVSDRQHKRTARMQPGEQASLQTDGEFAVQKVDVSSYVHWREGFFYYDNVNLLDIMKDLGRWYNVTIVFRNAEAMEYKLHYVADRRQDLQHAITLLNRMNKFKVTLKEDGRLYVE